ncbi:MAG TPA: tetratricopeptide repeat protein, partial [Sphingomicrobium sp.]|nr:tetratricopeptide repeat protein [Sphingomicrobium sp.]
PRGRPAATAGFSDEPAATQSSVATLDQRLDALERQMSDILRQSEENGHRQQSLEADLAKLRTDQEQRIATLEQRVGDAAASVPTATTVEPVTTLAKPTTKPKPDTVEPKAAAADAASATDAGEDAYTAGFRLWDAGKYDEAIAALRAFNSAYPKHRRVSYAKNLIGRSLLDKGDARGAAEAFLANYRSNSKGERAPDSLYYLGQSLMKLGQPGQACKAYAELDSVYGSKVRPDLQKQVTAAESEAKCN